MYEPKKGDRVEFICPTTKSKGIYIVDSVKPHPFPDPGNGYFAVYLKDYPRKGQIDWVASRWILAAPQKK